LAPRGSASSSSSSDTNNNRGKRGGALLRSELPSEQTTVDCFVGSLLQGCLSPVLVLLSSLAIITLREHDSVMIVDPLVGIAMAVLLVICFFPQLKNTMLILMQTVPENVNILRMKKEMLEKFKIIQNVHELHIWRLTTANIVATCHIVLPSQTTKEYSRLFESVKAFLATQYGITHVTIQPEFSNWNQKEDQVKAQPSVADDECFMKCPKLAGSDCEPDCNQLTCCAKQKPNGSSALDQILVHGHGHSHGGGGHGHSH